MVQVTDVQSVDIDQMINSLDVQLVQLPDEHPAGELLAVKFYRTGNVYFTNGTMSLCKSQWEDDRKASMVFG